MEKEKEEKERPFANRLGPMVCEIGQWAGFTMLEFRGFLAEAMQENPGVWTKEGVAYADETAYGYLSGKTWPNMNCAECVAIVNDALERAIFPDKTNEARIREAQRRATSEIELAFSRYASKVYSDSLTQVGGEEAIRASFQHMEPVVAHTLIKNMDACLSLGSDDIAFWKIIRPWDEERKMLELGVLSDYKGTFQAGTLLQRLESPELAQWLAIRDKKYTETFRTNKKPKTAKEIAAEAEKHTHGLTDEKLASVGMMIAAIQGDGTAKNPVYPRVELDLLLTFKYCLTEEKQKDLLARLQEKN